jgi:hypothetical protein
MEIETLVASGTQVILPDLILINASAFFFKFWVASMQR